MSQITENALEATLRDSISRVEGLRKARIVALAQAKEFEDRRAALQAIVDKAPALEGQYANTINSLTLARNAKILLVKGLEAEILKEQAQQKLDEKALEDYKLANMTPEEKMAMIEVEQAKQEGELRGKLFQNINTVILIVIVAVAIFGTIYLFRKYGK